MKLKLSKYSPHKPSPKQTAFLLYDGLEALYGGAAGGGKSDALLMAGLQHVDVPNYAAIIFRRSYTDLSLPGAIMDRAHEWLMPYMKTGEVKWDRETHTFNFKSSGASLTFGYIQTSNDKFRYQSAEFQYIAWDEVTEFPDEDAYTFLFSRLRKLKDVDIPLRVRCASNPVGPGTHWVRERFIKNKTEDRIFLPATFHDNPHIDAESYLKSLQQLPEITQQRLIEGSWDAIDDQAFSDFDDNLHVIPYMRPGLEWSRWEGMDFGVSNPTAWYAAAHAPEGINVIYDEYYQPGLISAHASNILTRRAVSWGQPMFAVCDPSIQNRTGFGQHGRGETVHSEFAKNGISLVPANNDRRAGFIRISELLRPDFSNVFPEWHPRAGEYGSPRLFITEQCPNLITQIRVAPLDPATGDMIDPYWETKHGHALAAARYLLTSRVTTRERAPAETVGRTRDWAKWASDQDSGWREL